MTQIDKVRAIPIREVFQRYGFEIGRGGFCRCPFHQERTPSCKVYQDSFYCFGCGAHGDAIDFVKQYDKVGFREAVDRLSAQFGIADDSRSTAQRVADGKAAFMHKIAREKREKEHKDLVNLWRSAVESLRYAEAVMEAFEPEIQDEEWSEAFCWSLKNLEIARIKADEAMEALNSFEKKYLQI